MIGLLVIVYYSHNFICCSSFSTLAYRMTLKRVVALYFFVLRLISVSSDFSSPPTTVKTNENTTVLLPCYLDTSNNDEMYPVRIKWYKDGDLLADNGLPVLLPPDRFKLWGNGSLEVVYVQPPDTGEYTCQVMRPHPWAPVKQIHAIEVLHPPSIESYPESGLLEVKLGEEVKIMCIGKGVPTPIITWRRNGKDLKLINNRNTLTFTASDRHLAGKYECLANNGVGEPAVKEIQLKVTYRPELETVKSWIHTAPGFRTQLDCRVTSDPSSKITWYKGEKPVTYDNRVLLLSDDEKYSLIIRNVQRDDFGIYICKAVNDIGEESLEFQLSGVPNQVEFKRTDDRNMNAETSYTLIWEVDSFTPVIEYSLWFRPYKPDLTPHKAGWTKLTIPSERKSNSGYTYSKMYTIRGLKQRTSYEALLLSRNRYGWSKASQILKFATEGADVIEEISTSVETETENIVENIIPSQITTSMSHIISSSSYQMPVLLLFILR